MRAPASMNEKEEKRMAVKHNNDAPIEVVFHHHSPLWWIMVGCWLRPLQWLWFSYIVRLFGKKVTIVRAKDRD